MDAGSTENATDVIAFLKEYNIEVDPAAPDEQQQNPVKREVQTLTKGVSALLLDQTALNANATSYNGGPSPFGIVIGKVQSLASNFQFPFGCPVTSTKIEGRDEH